MRNKKIQLYILFFIISSKGLCCELFSAGMSKINEKNRDRQELLNVLGINEKIDKIEIIKRAQLLLEEANSLTYNYIDKEKNIKDYITSRELFYDLQENISNVFKGVEDEVAGELYNRPLWHQTYELREKISEIKKQFRKKYHKEILEDGVYVDTDIPLNPTTLKLQIAEDFFSEEFNTKVRYLRIRYRIDQEESLDELDRHTNYKLVLLNPEGFGLKTIYLGGLLGRFSTGEFLLREKDFMSIDKENIILESDKKP